MPLQEFVNTFAGNPLDRASDHRNDPDWLAAQLADPRALGVALWNGRPLIEDAAPEDAVPGETNAGGDVQIAYLQASMVRQLAGSDERLLFLGLWKNTPVFACDLEDAADPSLGALAGMGRFEELRAVALRLPPPEAAICATAKGLFEWRRRHRFCAACGQASDVADGGWKRVCPSCRTEHFPRTDPVVIMLPVFQDRCLLGRQAAWPPGMFSALAGFLEPGESIEEACAREIREEAGLTADSVRYHSTQPWPYPSSLMIGLIAEVTDDQAAPDQTELEAVRWFTREEAEAVLRGRYEGVFAPPPLAIAHQLLAAWVAGF